MRWHVLFCNTQDINKITRRAQSMGVDCFYPTFIVSYHCKKEVKKEKKALFPSYLFMFFDYEKTHTSKILDIPGTKYFLKNGSKISVLDDLIIIDLKQKEPVLTESKKLHAMKSKNEREIYLHKILGG